MEHIGTQTIETERLIIRRFSLSDALSAYKNWAGDEYIQDMYGEPVYETVEKTAELIQSYIDKYNVNNDFYRWAVIEKQSGECIGLVAFFVVDNYNDSSEIEYCIGTPFQCKGYATEATKALIAFGFDRMKLHSVRISHRPSNTASMRVIQKCGFVCEGTLRDFFLRKDGFEGRTYYSILEDEYRSVKGDENSCKGQ